mmetsp:Transcript_20985/g.59524  ORF Transcript_20985/g.59524 Transcript_20985/m.59524 type:complete len:245 (-) Transcript_20985:227-961(-)
MQEQQEGGDAHGNPFWHTVQQLAAPHPEVVADKSDDQVCDDHEGSSNYERLRKVAGFGHGFHHFEVHPLPGIAVHHSRRSAHDHQNRQPGRHQGGVDTRGPVRIHANVVERYGQDSNDEQQVAEANGHRLSEAPDEDHRYGQHEAAPSDGGVDAHAACVKELLQGVAQRQQVRALPQQCIAIHDNDHDITRPLTSHQSAGDLAHRRGIRLGLLSDISQLHDQCPGPRHAHGHVDRHRKEAHDER